MKMKGNHILITGGASGIGYYMAKYFHEWGNEVLICGRRADRLAQVAAELPGIKTFKCDVSKQDDREALVAFVEKNMPNMNILINNAGIQRDVDLTKGVTDLRLSEIQINLEAPIYLSGMFTQMLAGRENAAIVNLTSRLGFQPERSVSMPIYAATKGALHNFSVVQRIQLEPLGIRVIEVVPPAVISELNMEGRVRRGTSNAPYMMGTDEYVQKTLAEMAKGLDEVRVEKEAGVRQ